MTKYYIDACIWRDYLEDRQDRFRPLGEWAFRFIRKAVEEESMVLFSDLVRRELRSFYTEKEIESLLEIVPSALLKTLDETEEQINLAKKISKRFEIPKNDALHAVLAKENDAILITRDAHFCVFGNWLEIRKPEDLI